MREDRVPHDSSRRRRRDPTRYSAQGHTRKGEPKGGGGESPPETESQNSKHRTRTKNYVRSPQLRHVQRDPGTALERTGRNRNPLPEGYRYDDFVSTLCNLR